MITHFGPHFSLAIAIVEGTSHTIQCVCSLFGAPPVLGPCVGNGNTIKMYVVSFWGPNFSLPLCRGPIHNFICMISSRGPLFLDHLPFTLCRDPHTQFNIYALSWGPHLSLAIVWGALCIANSIFEGPYFFGNCKEALIHKSI